VGVQGKEGGFPDCIGIRISNERKKKPMESDGSTSGGIKGEKRRNSANGLGEAVEFSELYIGNSKEFGSLTAKSCEGMGSGIKKGGRG